MNKYIKALMILIVANCKAEDLTINSAEQLFRSHHISHMLASQDANDAVELCLYYEQKVFRPEAAYYWANVAIKLGSTAINREKINNLEAKIQQSTYTQNEIALMPEALKNLKFQKVRSDLIDKIKVDKMNSFQHLKSLFMLNLDFAEEAFYWFSKENEISQNSDDRSSLKTLQQSIYLSKVNGSSEIIISGLIASESVFWRRLGLKE
ncbi:hypothetical protein [Prosthecobacter fluviatilis]|uniref:Uncharacterized protein n=1 Tax=Prosthecobacter fluviatilis TaxID=445931 RepID=A0ABW0L085_9BACT